MAGFWSNATRPPDRQHPEKPETRPACSRTVRGPGQESRLRPSSRPATSPGGSRASRR